MSMWRFSRSLLRAAATTTTATAACASASTAGKHAASRRWVTPRELQRCWYASLPAAAAAVPGKDGEAEVTAEEARRLMRLANVEALKRKLGDGEEKERSRLLLDAVPSGGIWWLTACVQDAPRRTERYQGILMAEIHFLMKGLAVLSRWFHVDESNGPKADRVVEPETRCPRTADDPLRHPQFLNIMPAPARRRPACPAPPRL
ncbi:hypothetical protein OsJ_03868 [Oryza sativa Japonica Group]|uniref:Uncharacterized protein n=1 Tax=Oryza sativa subsp. japonica TaxID=39947 RepID=A2ZYZ5_ORYSJ|nr:hypothetical protein OsJ_03868 [Oryza sativa Japonica Group]